MGRLRIIPVIVLSLSLPIILFQNFSYTENHENQPVFEFLDQILIKLDRANLGEGATSFSQFNEHSDKGYFAGRKINSSGVYFNLTLTELVENSNKEYSFKYKGDIFNTDGRPLVHDKQFRLLSAYDASIAWYNGTYWIAFECWSSDFGTKLGIAASTAICMGPLDQSFKLQSERVRVVVAGGAPLGDSLVYSASVPKLIVENGNLQLLWSSVRINMDPNFFRTRREYVKQQAISEAPAKGVGFMGVLNNFKAFQSIAASEKKSFASFEKWLLSDHKTKSNPKLEDVNQFYKWQADTYNIFDRAVEWHVRKDISGLAVGLKESPRAAYKFEQVDTWGTTVLFDDKMNPIVQAGLKNKAFNIAFTWQTELYQPILRVQSAKPGFSRVADVSDVRRINGRYIINAAVGGHSTAKPNDYCVAPTIGVSEEGCYRPISYRTDKVLTQMSAFNWINLRKSFEAVNIRSGATNVNFGDLANTPHEYARIFVTKNSDILFSLAVVDPSHQSYKNLQAFKFKEKYISENKIYRGSLKFAQSLFAGDVMISPNERYSLTASKEGLFLLDRSAMKRVWIHKVVSPDPQLIVQNDGNLVFYPKRGSPQNVWSTHRYSIGGRLNLQNDGNLVQYTPDNKSVWNSGTYKGY